MSVTQLTVAPVRPEDVIRVGEIGVAAFRGASYTRPSMSEEYAVALRAVEERAGGGATVLVARSGQDVLGSVTLAPAGTRWADLARAGEVEVRMLAVDPAVQARGTGATLMRAAVAWAGDRGYDALVLSVVSTNGPDRPHRLYERLGFRRDPSRDYVGSWEPHPQMWCYELPVRGHRG